MQGRTALLFLLLAALTIILFALDMTVGAVSIPVSDVWSALTGGDCPRTTARIIINIRLIKAIVALLAGAALSVSGLQMQTLFRNPLAGPYVLGISSGASLGVALVVLAGVGSSIGIAGAAWLGAAAVLVVIAAVGQRIRDIMVTTFSPEQMERYSVEEFSTDISVEEYIERFRDEKRFIELCKMCPNFGNSWGCPPFDFDTKEFLRQYSYAHLMAAKITPFDTDIPLGKTQEFILPERIRIEKRLLEMENTTGGRAFAYIGKCLHCPDADCTRRCGLPCRHPDKVRPSLEAFGFDIERTLSELFGIKLLWGKDGILPPYLVLVSAILKK